jgi:REP element-mobilizing transposase RayT
MPVRKHNRLKGYDYSREGAYFVTICTKKRECLFGEIIVGDGLARNVIKLSVYKSLMNKQNKVHYAKADVAKVEKSDLP